MNVRRTYLIFRSDSGSYSDRQRLLRSQHDGYRVRIEWVDERQRNKKRRQNLQTDRSSSGS